MQKLKVTASHLGGSCDGINYGEKVTFQVIQNGKVLVEDSLSGKTTSSFSKMYDVDASNGDLHVTDNQNDFSRLAFTSEFVD